ncbi:class I SAM-dependent methyltransferase, partial [bacterium]|nr:class I SAM-dependent methyltransferase [bacterium]
MKTRESGMPDEMMWDTFFDPEVILDSLGIKNVAGNIADLGCGYGTFTIPVAKRTKGKVYAIDIEKDMLRMTQEKVKQSGLRNVKVIQRDFMVDGTDLADS